MNIKDFQATRDKVTQLNQEADALYNLAIKAVEAGDADKAAEHETSADEIRSEADKLKEGLEMAQRLGEKKAAMREGRLPAGLPAGSDIDPPINGTPHGGQDEPDEDIAAKNIYRLRFKDEDDAVIAVLQDLHGKNYRQERLEQYDAFVRYLRRYRSEPDAADTKILKKIVIGPAQAKSAIAGGIDVRGMQKTLIEAVDELGGLVVPIDFQTEIIRRLVGFVIMRGRATVTQTTRDRISLPKLTGGNTQYTTSVRVTWVDEVPAAGAAATDLTWGQEQISVNTVMAETYLSRSLLEDAAVDIVDELATAYAEAQGIDEDNRFITGTGAGVPRGILIAGTTPETGVTTVNSGSAAALTADGVIDLQYGIASQYRGRGVFVANRSTAAVIRKFKDGMGQYLWQPSYQEGKPDMLLGRPFLEQEVMPSVAAGTYPLMFGDPTGYRIVERVGMTVERFLGGSEARQDRVLYIMRRRLGGQLTNAERWAVQLVSA
jgi:HK97 family phage major capsid protein